MSRRRDRISGGGPCDVACERPPGKDGVIEERICPDGAGIVGMAQSARSGTGGADLGSCRRRGTRAGRRGRRISENETNKGVRNREKYSKARAPF